MKRIPLCISIICVVISTLSCNNSDSQIEEIPIAEKDSLSEMQKPNAMEDPHALLECAPDTGSGNFRDFDLLRLAGICKLDSPSYPYVQVQNFPDSIVLYKWFSHVYPRRYAIRRMHGWGYWIEYLVERHGGDVEWMKIYFTTPQFLVHLKYIGDSWEPHNWEFYRMEVVYPDLTTLSAMPLERMPRQLKVGDLGDGRNFFDIQVETYQARGRDIRFETVHTKGGNFSYQAWIRFPDGAKSRIPRSIFWMYFDLGRIGNWDDH